VSTAVRLTLAAALAVGLASTLLGGVFRGDLTWLVWALAAVASVAAGAVVTRGRRLPEPFPTLAGAATLAVALTLLVARDVALWGFLPGPETLERLGAVAQSGLTDIAETTAPVPQTDGLLLLTALGVGVVALSVDLLAAGLRQPALAGLPLIAMFAVPIVVAPAGIGWLAFALAAAGWLGLLLADGRSRSERWGPPLSLPAARGRGAAPAAADPQRAVGRRIGAATVGLAIVVPMLVPGVAAGGLGVGEGLGGIGGMGGSSSASVDTYNPIVRLKGQLNLPERSTVLRVRTADPDYLRLTALDRYDGSTWSQSPLTAPRSQRVAGGIPAPSDLEVSTRQVEAAVTVVDLDTRWLPVPYPPRAVEVEGDWRYDAPSRTVFSSRSETSELPPYTVMATPADATPSELDAAAEVDPSLRPFLELPRTLPPEVVTLSEEITRGAATPYRTAVALQEFFRTSGGFVYDEQVPEGNSGDLLLDFLVERQGYCEQFAAAMAVMARGLDIPSRVAIGYTAGTEVEPGVYEVTTDDAHAWPELWFAGTGWLRFEPTPRADGATPAPDYTVPALQAEAPAPEPEAPEVPADREPAVPEVPADEAAAPAVATGDDGGRSLLLVGSGLAAVALLAVAPAGAAALRRRRAWAAAGGHLSTDDPTGGEASRRRAELAWRDVREQAGDLGLVLRSGDAPRAAAASLIRQGGLGPDPARALCRVGEALEKARYSARPPDDADLREAAEEARRGLRAGAGRRARVRSFLLPVSLRSAVGQALDEAGLRLRQAAREEVSRGRRRRVVRGGTG
jgi:transglutaminase-like putative cysteine protease